MQEKTSTSYVSREWTTCGEVQKTCCTRASTTLRYTFIGGVSKLVIHVYCCWRRDIISTLVAGFSSVLPPTTCGTCTTTTTTTTLKTRRTMAPSAITPRY